MIPTIADTYSFEVYLPLYGYVTMTPTNATLEWSYDVEANQEFARRKLKSALVFTGEDFEKLNQVNHSNDKCEKLAITISRGCEGEDIEPFYKGYLACVDGEWDPDRCKVSIVPRPDDLYRCIFEMWGEQRDLIDGFKASNIAPTTYGGLGVPIASTIHIIQGKIEYITCRFGFDPASVPLVIPDIKIDNEESGPSAPLEVPEYDTDLRFWFISPDKIPALEWHPDDKCGSGGPGSLLCGSGWLWVFNVNITTLDNSPLSSPLTGTAVYVREVVAQPFLDPPSGTWDWCSFDSLWTRQPSYLTNYMREQFLESIPTNPQVNPLPSWRPKAVYFENWVYVENYSLQSVLEWFLAACEVPVASDFFSINAPGEALDNDPYNFALNHYYNIRLVERSNSKRPRATQKATKEMMSFKDLLDDLAKFEVYWCIDDQDRFRLEHISWFEANDKIIDLTRPDLIKYIAFKGQYTHDISGIPRAENFKWPEPSDDAFDNGQFKYTGACLDLESASEQDIQIAKFMTNVGWLLGDPENSSDTGFTMLACTADDSISVGYTYTDQRLNAVLCWDTLLTFILRHNRPLPEGYYRGTPIPFFSSKKHRRQKEITFPICCDAVALFDAKRSIKTQLGWGDVESASLVDSGADAKITVQLRHQ